MSLFCGKLDTSEALSPVAKFQTNDPNNEVTNVSVVSIVATIVEAVEAAKIVLHWLFSKLGILFPRKIKEISRREFCLLKSDTGETSCNWSKNAPKNADVTLPKL